MRTRNSLFPVVWIGTLVLATLPLGCMEAQLPEELALDMPAGKQVTAPRNSGTADLTGSRWNICVVEFANSRTGETGSYYPGEWLLGRAELDERGGLSALMIQDLWFGEFQVSEILGERMLFDGRSHAAAFPGSTLIADNYTARDGAALNLSGYGIISVGPVEGGHAKLSIVGKMDEALAAFEGEASIDFTVNGAVIGGEDITEVVRFGVVAYRE